MSADKNFVMPPFARWIESAEPGSQNTWTRFRTEFSIAAVSKQAILSIAVDSKYWLWVNGVLLVREGGLKRGPTPHDTYVDQVDIASLLRPGRNVLAVHVWYWGVDSSSHQSSGHGALWVQGEIGKRLVASGGTWRVSHDPAFQPSDLRRFNNQTILSEWNIFYDATQADDEWTRPNYDDSAWSVSREIGAPPAAPWGRLVLRPIPFWADFDLRDYQSVKVDGRKVRARLPANVQIYPYFKIDTPTGLTVTVQIERDWKTTTYVTRAGVQSFEVAAWGNGHWVDYTFPEKVKILRLAYRETGYAAGFGGEFSCDDSRLNTLWTKSARSTYVNLRDGIMDCPDRERAQWPGDAVNTMDQGYYALQPAFHQLAGKFFSEVAGWRTGDGILWGAVPTGRFNGGFREFPGQMLPTVGLALENYLMHTGDSAGAEAFLPLARNYLLRHFKVDPQSLVEHRGPWENNWAAGTRPWYDWGDHQDVRLLDNVLYFQALCAVKSVGHLLNDASGLSEINDRMDLIRVGFFELFWNGRELQSPDYTGETDERGHAIAVLCDLIPDEHVECLKRILDHERHASIYFERFVLEAICRLGDTDLAVRRMSERYASVIASTYTTLPETWDEESNHAWGGGPLLALSKYVAGITPTAPGFKTYRIRPLPGPLKWIGATVPTPVGVISLRLRRGSEQITLEVDAPREATGMVELSGTWWHAAGGNETTKVIVRDSALMDHVVPSEENGRIQIPINAGRVEIIIR